MKYFLILALYPYIVVDYVSGNSPSFAADQVSKQSKQGDAFQRGLSALKDNRAEDALVEFTTAEREYPDDARVRSFRGILLAQIGKNAEAAQVRDSFRSVPAHGERMTRSPTSLSKTASPVSAAILA